MPAGPITPGSLITITPDTPMSVLPTSYNISPSPTMPVTSQNLQDLTQAMANADNLIGQLDYTFAGEKTFDDPAHFPGGIDGGVDITGGITKVDEIQFKNAVGITRTGYSQPVNQQGSWAMQATGFWTDTSTSGVLRIPVDVPAGAVLKKVHVWIDPANGHAGVPTVSIDLAKRVHATNTNTIVATQADTSASAGAYDALHKITLDLGAGHTISRASASYFVLLTGEGGGSALANLQYVGIDYDYEVTEVGVD